MELPRPMSDISACVDPLIPENFYIFGSKNSNECYFYKNAQKIYLKMNDIPKSKNQNSAWGHGCVTFEMNDSSDSNNINKQYYALIYGGYPQYYAIYNFKEREWDAQILKYNSQWIHFENIMGNLHSKYYFGLGLSMINDIFNTNIIHIAGGDYSNHKYGYFKFNHDFNAKNQSCLVSVVFVYANSHFFFTHISVNPQKQ